MSTTACEVTPLDTIVACIVDCTVMLQACGNGDVADPGGGGGGDHLYASSHSHFHLASTYFRCLQYLKIIQRDGL